MKIVNPVRQNEWRWPAILSLWLGGAGTGLYLFMFFSNALRNDGFSFYMEIPVGIMSAGMVGLGFLLLSIELGRPLRGAYLFYNLFHASISQEAACALLFFLGIGLYTLLSLPLFQILAAFGAAGLLLCQGFIVYRERGIPLWNVPAVPVFFVTSGLFSGCGIYLMAGGMSYYSFTDTGFGLGVLCLGLNLIAWIVLLVRMRKHEFRRIWKQINRPFLHGVVLGAGHFFPLVVIVAGLMLARSTIDGRLPGFLFFSAGAFAFVGVGVQKVLLIRIGGYTTGIRV